MPLFDYVCATCGDAHEHFLTGSERDDPAALQLDCARPGCGGRADRVRFGNVTYHPTIERWLELERGHLSCFQPPPVRDAKTGGGMRKYPGFENTFTS